MARILLMLFGHNYFVVLMYTEAPKNHLATVEVVLKCCEGMRCLAVKIVRLMILGY